MYPKRAGFMRNERMAKAADAAIVIWDGEARGSQNMIQQATNADILLYVYMFDKKKFLVELEKQMPVKEWKGL